MTFNTKNWNIQDEIAKRAKKESDYLWSISNTNVELPKYEKVARVPLSAGLYNMLKQILP